MNTASTFRRLIAKMIDQIIVGIFWLPVLIQGVSSYFNKGHFYIEWKWLILCFLLQFSYKVFFLKFLQATIGKGMMGLLLVSVNGENLSWMQVILRVLADHLSVFFGWGLYALAFLRFDRTHVSDWVAETRVVQGTPRGEPVQRRIILALFLFFYFSSSQFFSIYAMMQKTTWEETGIHFDITYAKDF